MAWKWLVKHGVVTGGDNPDVGKDDTCWPYEIPMCSHHVKSDCSQCYICLPISHSLSKELRIRSKR